MSQHPDSELPATEAEGDSPTLKQGRMGLIAGTAFALTALQVGPAISYSAAYLQGTAGPGGWLSLVGALVLTLAMAGVVAAYAARYVVSGSLLSYAFEVFGSGGRLLVACCLLVGYQAALSATATVAVLFGVGALVDLGWASGGAFAVQLALIIGITGFASLFAYLGIDTSVRVGVTLASLCVPVVLWVLASALLHHGVHAAGQFHVSTLPWAGIASGVTVGFGFFVGFDGITALAEETHDSRKSMPFILVASVLIYGIALVLSCVLEAGLVSSHAADLDAGVSPLSVIARQTAWPGIGTLGNLCIALAATAATIAYANYGARIMATAAVDGLIPGWIAAIHRHYRTPHRAVLIQSVLSTLLPVAVSLALRATPLELTTYVLNIMVFIWLIPYIVLCLGTLVIAYRERRLIWVTLACAAVGVAGCVGLIIHTFSLDHADVNWWLAVASYATVIAAVVLCLLTRRRIPVEVHDAPGSA